ncbi:MAG TPA: dynamin family protein [Pilimelia sp.]|nr:dynamin family protein [Pilimelia sp.]
MRGLRTAIGAATYPLVLPSAEDARRVGAALVSQLDDYLLPRLARLDAPLLVVVGGSTGAGKSTLVNSLVRAPVSAAGVLRPTTRAPVLVCHPHDSPWFRQGDLLPGLTRTAKASTDPHSLQLVTAPALTPGLALLDAPDIDSVVDTNRALAAQLLAAADLWLFVTTAARYADAVPWELLRTARLRGTVTALVLDRVPQDAADEISDHLRQMLAVHQLDKAPLFVLPEAVLDGQGLLSEQLIGPLRGWLSTLAADSAARSAVVRQTLDGALTALVPAVEGLAAAADAQIAAATTLGERVTAAHRAARATVEHGMRDGTLLRGEVLARWQEYIGTGEFFRSLEARIGWLRDRVTAAVTGRPAPGRQLANALESNLVAMIRGAAADAAEHTYTGWQAHPAGAALLTPELARPAADLAERAERLVRDWQRAVLELVRAEGADRRFVARSAAYAVNATGLAVMIAVFASTAFIPTGLEVAAGAGTTVAAQKVLEAIFGDQAIRALAGKARDDLLARVEALLGAEAARYQDLIESVGARPDLGTELRAAAEAVDRRRAAAALTAGAGAGLPAPEGAAS